MIIMMIAEGATTPEIVKETGADPRSVLYWRKKLEREEREGMEAMKGGVCSRSARHEPAKKL